MPIANTPCYLDDRTLRGETMPSVPRTGFVLEVVGGEDHGARLEVTSEARTIGRARDSDLVLKDLGVSRRHLQIVATEEGVRFDVCGEAASFMMGGRPLRSVEARPGDRILVGNTLLVIAPPAPAATTESRSADVRTLLTGIGADTRAMAAIHTLIEVLDTAEDSNALSAALAAWSSAQTPSCTVEICRGAGASTEFGERENQGATTLIVPAPTDDPVSIEFRCSSPSDGIPDSFRRMLVVAGRLFGSSASRLRRVEVAAGEVAALRALSFGTAHDFIGSSPAAQHLASRIPRLALSDVSVLLEGETGVGKTFVARLIHEASPRSREPLRVINCAAIPEALVESELFGHERGAFTGAVSQRVGALEAAGRGTLFLDEIGELSQGSQAKLLRVLEERKFERVGSNHTLELRARVLCATNRDLDQMVSAGKFRQDLLFRLAVVRLRVPPLRERGDDLLELARQLLTDAAQTAGRRVLGFSPAAAALIGRYSWPGNVRELRNAIDHAVALGEGPLVDVGDLPPLLSTTENQPDDPDLVRLPIDLPTLERRAVEAALRATGGNRLRAAALLNVNRSTLYNKLREYGL
jgi:DNA-binding NtrC family response regulator